ncbi:hypothetical protein GHT09_016088 [Marmota monax]|uniref:Uncharacterized protein n=1 Tax=Marmota monax TaxID=9995 RepID=A0A834Q5P2_MARMO|nr:hypothetical protein GHT09_016088 [Marmota monax]
MESTLVPVTSKATGSESQFQATWSHLETTLVSTGAFRGVCKKIDHFPEDADYEQDTAEYLLRKSLLFLAFSWGNRGWDGRVPCRPPAASEFEVPPCPHLCAKEQFQAPPDRAIDRVLRPESLKSET